MHDFLFGYDLSDQDCLDLLIEQKYIDTGIQTQIDFIIAFDLDNENKPPYDCNYVLNKNGVNSPEFVFCTFRGKSKYVAIFWHD